MRIMVSENENVFTTQTRKKNVGDFLAEQGIEVGDDDYLFPPKSAQLNWGTKITIQRAFPVTIKVDEQEIAINTLQTDVKGALADAQVTLSHLDKVSPSLETVLENDLGIMVTRINVEEIEEEETVEFEIVEKNDNKLKWRKKVVQQEGENGLKKARYKITYTNGKQTSKVKLSSEVIREPVDKIVKIGTKIEVGKVSKGAATWYAHTGTMACASLEHPIGTWLRVTNRENGKQVIVQVNDRGPFGEGRIIDLDKVAFEKIASIGQGVVNVKVEEILD